MTPKRRRCPWTVLAASLGLAGAAAAGELPPGTDLYLEVAVNHVELRRVEHFLARDGHFYADAQTLLSLGLTWPGAATASGLVDLASLPDLQFHYDAGRQRLEILAPVELLGATTSVGYAPPPAPQLDPQTRAPGLLLNYDLYAQRTRGLASASGWNELRLFGAGPGVWRTSSVLQSAWGPEENRQHNVRLDTSWQLDFPEPMVTASLGDAISGGLTWTRSVRFGGLRIARDFSLQPYRATVPLAAFVGQTALPSVVDLYINGLRTAQAPVPPGQFQVLGVPVITGTGNARIVVTDINGQRQVVDIPLYNNASLLQKGLGDWSFETGALRRNYGLSSFDYADSVMGSASGRYGWSDDVTLEAHGEGSRGLAMGGAGAFVRLGQAGVANASYAASSQGGHQYGAGHDWRGDGFNVSLSALRRDEAFRDLGTLEGSTLPLASSQAFVGWNVGHAQLGASFVHQQLPGSPATSFAGVSWSQGLGRYGYLSVGANRELHGHGGTVVYAFWSVPLGNQVRTWASGVRQAHGSTASVGAARNLPGDADGWGWRVQANAGANAGGQAEVSQLTRHGEWRAGGQYLAQSEGGVSTAYAAATGGMLLMQGRLFAMRRVYDAFALVSTDGVKGVPVKLENRLVGATDDAGLLLVTPLNAWQDNDLSIDPRALPADVSVGRVRMLAVPSRASGMLARFPMQAMLMIDLSVRSAAGEAIPAGTRATLEPGQQSVIVGYDGRVYLENPPAGARLAVPLATGECLVALPDPLPVRGRIDLGELACR